jgi:hypothetical protein
VLHVVVVVAGVVVGAVEGAKYIHVLRTSLRRTFSSLMEVFEIFF